MVTVLVLVASAGIARASGYAPLVAGALDSRTPTGWGIETDAGLGRAREVLRAGTCTACTAWRDTTPAHATLRVATPAVGRARLGAWASAGRAPVEVAAAETTGDAWLASAGAQAEGGRWAGWLGAHVAGMQDARAAQARAGAAWTAGSVEDGVRGWLGVEATLTVTDSLDALGGAVPLRFTRTLPLDVVGGMRVVSDPLGGPWARRGRLFADVRGALGGRAELGGALGWAW